MIKIELEGQIAQQNEEVCNLKLEIENLDENIK